jgi:hypothetical protein
MEHPTFDEISDPKTRTKLQSIQGYVTDLDGEILKVRDAANANAAAAKTASIISKRITQEMIVAQDQIEKDMLDPSEAKLRISQTQRIVIIVNEMMSGWQADAITLKGKVQGLETAVKVGEGRFNAEKGKWERHKRMEEEEEQERRDMLTSPASKSKSKSKKAVAKKSVVKSKNRPSKKSIKRKANK